MLDFNPRSPCGERLQLPYAVVQSGLISIHAPRVGSDLRLLRFAISDLHFNPRSPCGERPTSWTDHSLLRYFNPRSPCGERPATTDRERSEIRNFNPRSPCGERPHKCTIFKCVFMKKNLEFVICSSLYVISCRRQQRLSTSSYKYPCEPIQILMYASASLYRISGSSGRYVCLQPKCSILSS